MRRSSILGAAAVAALAAGTLAVTERQRLEPPRGAVDPRRPDRRQHRPLRVHGAGRAGQPDDRLELDPVRGSLGRPVLRQARSEGALLRQDRQHRRRARGRRLPLAVQADVPQPELVPVRRADGRLGRRSGPQLRPDVRPLPGDVQQRASSRASGRSPTTCRSRRTTSGRRRSPNYAKVSAGAVKTLRGGVQVVRRPRRRRVLHRPRDHLRRDQHRQAGPAGHRPRQPGRRQGRRRRLQHALVRAAGPRVRGDERTARASRAPDAPNAVVGVWSTTERKRITRAARARKGKRRDAHTSWVQVSRVGNPLINEVVIPIGLKDKYNRTSPAERRGELRRERARARAGEALNALFGLGVKETDRTDIVQALLTGVPGLTQIGSNPARGRHAEGQPRRAAQRDPEPLRRAGEVTSPASRTAAGSPTTSSTSSCASSPARC